MADLVESSILNILMGEYGISTAFLFYFIELSSSMHTSRIITAYYKRDETYQDLSHNFS